MPSQARPVRPAETNIISFDNKSGEPAMVKVVGPTTASLQVPNEAMESVSVLPGRYRIKVRYGSEGKFRYALGEEFQVAGSPMTTSVVTITLHAVPNGNYHAQPTTAYVFDKDATPVATQEARVTAAAPPTVPRALDSVVLQSRSEEYRVVRMLLDPAGKTRGEALKLGLGEEATRKVMHAVILEEDGGTRIFVSQFVWNPPDLPRGLLRIYIPHVQNTDVVVRQNGNKIWSQSGTHKDAFSPVFDIEKGEDGAAGLSVSVESDIAPRVGCLGGVDNIYLLKPKTGDGGAGKAPASEPNGVR